MGWDIQINPKADSLRVSFRLAELLDLFLEDFNIRYAFLEPDPGLITALHGITPQHEEEAQAISKLLEGLQSGQTVELFLAH